MTRQRKFGSAAAIGGSIAAIALLAGSSAARADELADLRANQELLQKRIDQLSQAPPAGAPGPYVPGFGAETRPLNAPVTTGSFPRSFLIPGTDTSLRIGGYANGEVIWALHGAAPSGQLNSQGGGINQTFTDGLGGTGNLASIPLNNSIAHARSNNFEISGRNSRLLFDARTPTAWGEAKAYIEMDFNFNNATVVYANNQASTDSAITRLRKAYATLGGLLAGQDTGILHDPDADPELVDQGGMATAAGRGREAQVKYTYQGPYGTVFNIGGENPVPRLQSIFGQVDIDTQQIPNTAACSVTGNTAANLPATTACLGSNGFFSPLQATMPEWIATARINQPWGHLQVGGIIRNDRLDDGQFLNQSFIGYGGTISGDVHPFAGVAGPLAKDDLGFGLCIGNGMANQCANGSGMVTNFGAAINVPGVGIVNPLTNTNWNQGINARVPVNGVIVRQGYDRLVRTQTVPTQAAWLWYQHWWTDNLRSTAMISGIYNDVNQTIAITGSNKELADAAINLFWSPVAFIDFGGEYFWGHRVTTQNFKGDNYAIEGLMRVRF
jgi:DcaP outer membrane protein/Porin subfamily